MPITVTEKAAREVGTLLDGQGKQGAMLRLWVAGAGCGGLRYGMGIDEKEPEKDDSVFESNGVRVVIDPQSLSFMDGSTVDWIEDVENGGFNIENPNPPPETDCDCGTGGSCCGDS
jgi:iron-sulfur cluster assembly protein